MNQLRTPKPMTPFHLIPVRRAFCRLRTSLLVGLALPTLCFIQGASFAHEGGHGDQAIKPSKNTWTLQANKSHFHGTFLSANESHVKIETTQGKVREVPIDQLSKLDQDWIAKRQEEIRIHNTTVPRSLIDAAAAPATRFVSTNLAINAMLEEAPSIHEHFKPFEKTLGLRWDNDYYYVESNGIPDHPMMIGITAWQQQVPLPQSYTGRNAWRIPLNPKPAAKPMSAKRISFAVQSL
jgi:hypothetical protein